MDKSLEFNEGAMPVMADKGTFRYKLTKITVKTIIAGAVGLVMFYAARGKNFDPAWSLPGAFFIFAGEGIRLWAAGHLRKNKQLTTTGPYAYVKNPLYIGTLLIAIGYGTMSQNVLVLLACFIWFFIYYAPYKKNQEGKKLFASFGNAWVEYDKAVPSYFPRLKAYRGRAGNAWSYDVVRENSEHETAIGVFVGFAAMLFLLVH
jgi:protein-S-isoprenylcysteine O-methyltransferase Ste14